jgi:hypothetical protein
MKTPPKDLAKLALRIRELSESLSVEQANQLSPPQVKQIHRTLIEAYRRLGHLTADLDPIKQPGFVFDPANPNVVGRIVGITMIAQPRISLTRVDRFYGSGIYAIYYRGDFSAYKRISKRENPIYVGKADPAEASAKTAVEQGERLARRINDHRKNITKAGRTLRLKDFDYRALVVQTGWQSAAEEYLIDLFKPIWNSQIGICYGFGKHGDDPGTRANLRSPWDTLHPGRDWAHRDPKMKDARPRSRIVKDIQSHFAKHRPVKSIDEVLRNFLEEMRKAS